jgi:hypothetical protein
LTLGLRLTMKPSLRVATVMVAELSTTCASASDQPAFFWTEFVTARERLIVASTPIRS